MNGKNGFSCTENVVGYSGTSYQLAVLEQYSTTTCTIQVTPTNPELRTRVTEYWSSSQLSLKCYLTQCQILYCSCLSQYQYWLVLKYCSCKYCTNLYFSFYVNRSYQITEYSSTYLVVLNLLKSRACLIVCGKKKMSFSLKKKDFSYCNHGGFGKSFL